MRNPSAKSFSASFSLQPVVTMKFILSLNMHGVLGAF